VSNEANEREFLPVRLSPGEPVPPAFFDFCSGQFWELAGDEERAAQERWQASLRARGDVRLGRGVFVSQLAAFFPKRFAIGDNSYVGAHAYVTDEVTFGDDCTLNPYAMARGRVRAGSGVRVGAHSALLGFNHSTDPGSPVFTQPLRSKGIVLGDDVWIGSHATVLDGVTIGSHAVIGGGAVVTRDVADWAVVAGNPARAIGDRRTRRRPGAASLEERFVQTAARACEQARALLDRAWSAEVGSYLNAPGAPPTRRAWCDAVELSDLLTADPLPPGRSREEVLAVLRGDQDEQSGLVPELCVPGTPHGANPEKPGGGSAAAVSRLPLDGHAPENYHILCIGYALELLGSSFARPVLAVDALSAHDLVARLDSLPWDRRGWLSGSAADALATAIHFNRRWFGRRGEGEALFGWLLGRCDPAHGMWGRPDGSARWLEVVNGFYRAARGSFAQFGLPLPYPERVVDTVLAHGADTGYFRDDLGTACNVLDVVHPLWLVGKQTGQRRAEAERWVRWQAARLPGAWVDDCGFSFELATGPGERRVPSLLGTEMWLSIAWLMADYLGFGDALPYRPRGIHRPEPVATLVPAPAGCSEAQRGLRSPDPAAEGGRP
jgi:acetyltransferase-like isoleucine patch superfamily enzyme